jgi:SAM-dependent MidA family methyltransferase
LTFAPREGLSFPPSEKEEQMTTPLGAWILERIRREGPVTFEEFMGWALYHPSFGYYSSGKVRIGSDEGDFTTSPHVSSLFAITLGRFVISADEALGSPEVLHLVEGGPGEGRLASDLLDFLEKRSPELYRRVRYFPEETSPELSMRQAKALYRHQTQLAPKAPESYEGVYFSNELLDAFPVRRFILESGAAMELFVEEREGHLAFKSRLAESSSIPGRIPRPLAGESWGVEVCEEIPRWLSRTASKIKRGYLLTLDYGDKVSGLYGPHRPEGTVRGFRGHAHLEDLLSEPGSADLTASVDFSALIEEGEKLGLDSSPLMLQRDFLFSFGLLEEAQRIEEEESDELELIKTRNAIGQLIMPGTGMGESFRALVQSKDASITALGLSPR